MTKKMGSNLIQEENNDSPPYIFYKARQENRRVVDNDLLHTLTCVLHTLDTVTLPVKFNY